MLSGIGPVAKFAQALFPPLFPQLQTEYGIGSTETGLLFSVMVGYGLIQFPSGILADWIGTGRVSTRSTVAVVGMIVVVVPPLLRCAPRHRRAFGFGIGVHKTVSMKGLSQVYSRDRDGAIGTFDTFGFVGAAVTPLALVGLGVINLDWQVAFALRAAVGFVFAALNRMHVT